ncbi:DUF1254 domain-containing protein [Bordetella genomosp. 11]|uniref:DUF1254 domain-containing protein n=1 Tax=Bordetella genomosp. 11 TaxID=1416808 RepID=A0A261UM22_9BORD|nr:DUF1254 domain-containing protein [Bordetella genomosp. 11]OZI62681.1 hypothetical protein CAL28_26415 [Bordetella genomosp. 11]
MRTAPQSGKWRLAALACVFGVSGIAAAQSPQPTLRMVSPAPAAMSVPLAPMSAQELHQTAVDAYIYAYPLVLMELTRRNTTNVSSPLDGKAPMNQFGHKTAFPDASTPNSRWPNTDTLYSSMWYDVSNGPLIVRVPDAGDRFYVLSLLDMWTDVFASRGTRTNGKGPQAFAIVGPYWNGTLPPGLDVVRSPTSMGWVVGHVQTGGQQDYPAVNQWQANIAATPYVAPPPVPGRPASPGSLTPMYPGSQAARPVAPMPPAPAAYAPTTQVAPSAVPPVEQIAGMDAATFFGLFADALRSNPPHANDYPMLDRLRRIGLGTTPSPAFSQLDPAVQQALTQAGPEAGRRIADYVSHLGSGMNGWNTVSGGIGTYGTNYLRRAAVAYAGLGAGLPEDIMYPVTLIDSDGDRLSGDEDYVLHFDKGQLPPVNAFWSLNLYGPDQTFVDNPARRYAIRSTDNLRYNADGSLDIYIQHRAPSRERQANWLPAPDSGPFMLNMRLYWPRDIALDRQWAPPPVHED